MNCNSYHEEYTKLVISGDWIKKIICYCIKKTKFNDRICIQSLNFVSLKKAFIFFSKLNKMTVTFL